MQTGQDKEAGNPGAVASMNDFTPSGLELPELARAHWPSAARVLSDPGHCWPRELLEQPAITRHVGRRQVMLLADPDALQAVLTAREGVFQRPRLYDRIVGRQVAEDNLVLARGPNRERHRRALAPFWHPRRMAAGLAVMNESAGRLVERWAAEAPAGPVDAVAGALRVTLTNICHLLFGFGAEDAACMVDVEAVAAEIDSHARAGAINDIAAALLRLIDRLSLSSPVVAVDDDNPFAALADTSRSSELSRAELVHNALLFMTAGHETSALTLAWALWLLAHDTGAQEALYDEIHAAGVGDILTLDDLQRLPGLNAALDETMRLFPTAPIIARQASAQVTLAGTDLEAGDVILVCFYALHRHRRLWHAPDTFRARRFLDDEDAISRHRFAFLPFSAGPHICVGSSIAVAQMTVALATIVRRFRLAPAHGRQIPPRFLITLRPQEPVPLLLTPRD